MSNLLSPAGIPQTVAHVRSRSNTSNFPVAQSPVFLPSVLHVRRTLHISAGEEQIHTLMRSVLTIASTLPEGASLLEWSGREVLLHVFENENCHANRVGAVGAVATRLTLALLLVLQLHLNGLPVRE